MKSCNYDCNGNSNSCELCKKTDKQNEPGIKKQAGNKLSQEDGSNLETAWRRHCGCLKTSDKLKELLKQFPAPAPPPPPSTPTVFRRVPNIPESSYVPTCCTHLQQPLNPNFSTKNLKERRDDDIDSPQKAASTNSWHIISDLIALLQLSVTATALGVYYIIYCYMQLVYFALRSAMFFHQADGPMKVTIGVVTVSSLVVGFNLMLRLERMVGLTYL